jgi:acyl-CoA synthetase (AMP-forming)/AMP-acid ligase II
MNDRDILSMAVTPEMTGLRRLTQQGLLRSSVLHFPEKTALVVVHGYRQVTYGELWERTNRLANALSGLWRAERGQGYLRILEKGDECS